MPSRYLDNYSRGGIFMISKYHLINVFSFLIIAILFLFPTCKVGLGESVDTVPPTVSIAYPPTKSIIRGTFNMTGVATDETKLASVTVTLDGTDYKSRHFGPYEAKVDSEKGTWSLDVNPSIGSNYAIPDGSYNVTVVAEDSAKRKSSASVIYEIDNTAPVIVMEGPGSTSEAVAYGSIFTITGQIVDTNSVSSVFLSIYSEPQKELLYRKEINNVSQKLNLTVGYADDKDLYDAVYGSDDVITKYFNYVIEAYDEAQEYPKQTERNAESDKGNLSSGFFMFDELSAQKDIVPSGVKGTDVHGMFNGNYYTNSDGSVDSAKKTTALNFLQSVIGETGILVKTANLPTTVGDTVVADTEMGKFSLNPSKDPTYEVLDSLLSVSSDDEANKKSFESHIISTSKTSYGSVSVKISRNLDNVALCNKDAIKIVLKSYDGLKEDGSIKTGDTEYQIWPNYHKDASFKNETSGYLIIAPLVQQVTEEATETRVTTGKYIIEVTGMDVEENSFSSKGKTFGISVQGSGNGPTIETLYSSAALDGVNGYIKKDDFLTISGTATLNGTEIANITNPEMTYYLDGTVYSSNAVNNDKQSLTQVGSTSVFNWAITIDNEAFGIQSKSHTVKILAHDIDLSKSTEEVLYYFYDVDAPKIDVTKIAPMVTYGGREDCVNGTISINATITDNDKVEKTTYQLFAGSGAAKTKLEGWTEPKALPDAARCENLEINTTTLKTTGGNPYTTGELTIQFVTTDRAGNSATTDEVVYVDPDSDKPVVSVTNKESSGITLLDTVSNNKLLFNVTDDDSVGYVEIFKGTTAENLVSVQRYPTSGFIGKTTYSNSYALGATEGEFYIQIKAYDTNGTPVEGVSEVFTVAVDKETPALSITNAQKVYVTSPFELSGTATDTSGISKIEIYKDASEIAPIATTDIAETDATKKITTTDITKGFSWSYEMTEGKAKESTVDSKRTYSLIVRATDKYNKTSDTEYVFYVDTVAPSVTVIEWVSGNFIHKDSSPYYKVTATTADDGGGSGIKALRYGFVKLASIPSEKKLGNNDWTSEDGIPSELTWINGTKVSSDGLNEGWKADIAFDSVEDGYYALYVSSIDEASNVTNGGTYQIIYVDTKAPKVAIITSTVPPITKEGFTISGTCEDDNMAFVTIEVFKETTAEANKVQTTVATLTDNTSWSGTISAPDKDGKYIIVVTAKDTYGRETKDNASFIRDITAPLGFKSDIKETWYGSDMIAISGTVAEALSGVSTVEYSFDNAEPWSELSVIKGATGTVSWNGSIAISSSCTNQSLYFKITDLAENSLTEEVKINVDLENPSLEITEPSSTPLLNGNADFNIVVSATDNHSGIKTIKAKVGSSNFTAPSATGTYDPITEKWALTIPLSAIPEYGTQFTVYIQATDFTGKTAVQSLVCKLDRDAPSVKFVTPGAGAEVNGNVTISGTAGDDQGLDTVVLYRLASGTKESGTWEELARFSDTAGYNWSFSVDTADTTTYTDDATAYFKAVSKDKAGNQTEGEEVAYLDLAINQDTDRPVITITNASLNDMTSTTPILLIQTEKLYGTISDDDGVVQKLEIKLNNGEFSTVQVSNGFWEYPFPTNGAHSLSFQITDKAGNVFTTNTSGSDSLSTPKLTDGKVSFGLEDSTIKDTTLYITVDTKNPSISPAEISLDGGTTWNSNYSAALLGGTVENLKVRVTASDDNGIKSVVATAAFSGETGTTYTEPTKNGDVYTFDIPTDTGSGHLVITIRATDTSGLESATSFTVSVDNQAPVISVIAPTAETQVSGDITARGTLDSSAELSYVVSASNVTPISGYSDVTDASLSWYIYFDDDSGLNDGKTHAKTVNQYLVSLGITTQEALDNNTYNDTTSLYLHLKAKDEAGNESDLCQEIKVDPQGGRPKLDVVSPANGTTQGGSIRLYGTAEDDVQVESVWVQIISTKEGKGSYTKNASGAVEDFIFTGSAAKFLDGLSSKHPVFKMSDGTTSASALADAADASEYAIKANFSGSSWNLTLNELGEFNPGETGTNEIAVRVYAYDGTSFSLPFDRVIIVDKDNPLIGNSEKLYVVQYENDGSSGNIVASREYEEDMYVTGQWYLTGSLEDASDIKKVMIGTSDITSNTTYLTAKTWGTEGAQTSGYVLSYPVGVSATGEVGTTKFDIIITENTEKELNTTKAIRIHYDNKAPVLVTSGEGHNISTSVKQSNNFYTFGSKVTEETINSVNQSGFARVAFYFTRTLNGETSVYDPMLVKTDGNNKITIDATNYVNDSGLIWKKITVTRDENNAPVLTLPSADPNVRKGSLVKIAGSTYLVSNVSGASVTLDGSPLYSTPSEVAYFALAQIVDNTTSESESGQIQTDGYYLAPLNDDGDRMIESVNKVGTSYTWEASICSKNIPDGPITIHYVAFDKAGNYASSSVAGFVENNRPRLALIKAGTDDNGNGTVDNAEFKEVYSAFTNDTWQDSLIKSTVDLTASSQLKVKGDVAIKPTIVGGNGDLYYGYNIYNAIADTVAVQSKLVDTSETGTKIGTGSDTDSKTEMGVITIPLKNLLGADGNTAIADGTNKKFAFTIWDSTEGTTEGTNSLSATMTLSMDIVLRDTEKPVVAINDLFWTSETENSLYNNSANYGHMDFGGSKPAVSGSIVYRGTVTDNSLLTNIYASIDNFSMNGSNPVAVYDTTTGEWSSTGDFASNGWKFEVTKNTIDQSGHSVEWSLTWNSSKITGKAARDIALSVYAEDRGSASWTTELIYVKNISDSDTYAVDVVPYITRIKTALHTTKKNNWSVYNRTARGKYPVSTTETITLYGFNLNTSSEQITTEPMTGQTCLLDSETLLASSLSSSGPLSYTVSGVELQNNVNDNNQAYNKQPNGDNNLLLTDDIDFDVWQFNSEAAKPISGLISDPVMKISPTSGMIGFAFTNGPLYFSMPGKTKTYAGGTTIPEQEYSYVYWQGSYDFMSSVGLHYDSAGYTYGSAVGGDINSTSADRFSFMTSRWGVSGAATSGSYDGTNALRLEAIGQYGDSAGANTGTLNFDKGRIKSPEYATARHGTSTNIYLAYFDNLNDEIRFRYGELSGTEVKKNFGNFFDDYRNNEMNNGNNLSNGKYNLSHVNVIAGSTTGRKAGEFVSIGVIPGAAQTNDIVVLVWYDSYNKKLYYTYNIEPTAGTTGVNVTKWSTPKEIFEDAGEYCKLVVDADKGIHIAAYDGTEGDLKYAYLASYDATTVSTCTVDSYAIVGQYITLDVAKVGTDNIPYIGYYALSSAKPKLAYRVSSTISDGSINEEYTGDWEISLIPTSKTTLQDRVNVGLWKDGAGVLKTSTTGTSSAGQYYGRCFGNGTSNPVLGYAIRESSTKGYIETAQKK